jgi:hypothetical protein
MSDAEVTRDLSSVVGGLHGGKYQFGAGGAQYYAGSIFAASLAASVSEAAAAPGGELEAAEWPRWASELRAQPDALAGVLAFAGAGDVREARVENTYRTWEPWVAAVLTAEGEVAAVAAESPYALVGASSGTLAPRGGASNVCDASKPYSDAAYVRVQCCAPPGAPAPMSASWPRARSPDCQWSCATTATDARPGRAVPAAAHSPPEPRPSPPVSSPPSVPLAPASGASTRHKVLVGIAIAAAITAFFALDLGRYLTLDAIKARQAEFAGQVAARPIASAAVFFLVYVLATALSLPGAATVLTLLGGALFGLGWGLVRC